MTMPCFFALYGEEWGFILWVPLYNRFQAHARLTFAKRNQRKRCGIQLPGAFDEKTCFTP